MCHYRRHISRWYYNEHNYRFSLLAFYFNHSQISLPYSVTGDMKEKTQNTSYLPRPEDRFTDLFSNISSYISDLYHLPLIFSGSGEEGRGEVGVQLTNFKIRPWCRSSWFQMLAVDIDVKEASPVTLKNTALPQRRYGVVSEIDSLMLLVMQFYDVYEVSFITEVSPISLQALSLLLCSCFLKLITGWAWGNAGEGELKFTRRRLGTSQAGVEEVSNM